MLILRRIWFPVRHPRDALCDAGLWKCRQHPRMLWLASERRWALRHKLRARRVARYTGWAPGELRGHIEREKRALCERLAADMAALVARHPALLPPRMVHTHGPERACGGPATGCQVATVTGTNYWVQCYEAMRADFELYYEGQGVSMLAIDEERYRW